MTLCIGTQKHFEACFKQFTVSHFITLLVMINATTTCEFMEDCLDMFFFAFAINTARDTDISACTVFG